MEIPRDDVGRNVNYSVLEACRPSHLPLNNRITVFGSALITCHSTYRVSLLAEVPYAAGRDGMSAATRIVFTRAAG